jgi:hypothetical protein
MTAGELPENPFAAIPNGIGSHADIVKADTINSLIILFTDLTVLFVMPEDLNRVSIPG